VREIFWTSPAGPLALLLRRILALRGAAFGGSPKSESDAEAKGNTYAGAEGQVIECDAKSKTDADAEADA